MNSMTSFVTNTPCMQDSKTAWQWTCPTLRNPHLTKTPSGPKLEIRLEVLLGSTKTAMDKNMLISDLTYL